jgi:hypothetical protein
MALRASFDEGLDISGQEANSAAEFHGWQDRLTLPFGVRQDPGNRDVQPFGYLAGIQESRRHRGLLMRCPAISTL